MKQAIILAAGVGKRLGVLTNEIPKCLLPIDSKRTILDLLLENINQVGINEVAIVTGYKEEKLYDHIRNKWSSSFVFKIISNPMYETYNNIYSAYLAKESWTDETVLLNSDVVFDLNILQALKNVIDMQTKSFLVTDDINKLDKEDMKVEINKNGEIKRINKALEIEKSYGEYIGITYLRGKEREKFIESLEKNVRDKNFDLYYEDALDQILNNISVYPFSTQGKKWTEIDTKEDYAYAKEIIYESHKYTNKTLYTSFQPGCST